MTIIKSLKFLFSHLLVYSLKLFTSGVHSNTGYQEDFFLFNISQLVSSGVHGNTGSQGKLGFYRITLVPSDFLKALAAIRFILKLLSLFLDFTILGSAKIL